MCRYEECWVPFIKQHSAGPDSDLDFLPPLDVHWAWHVHMLAPVAYRKETSPAFRISDKLKIFVNFNVFVSSGRVSPQEGPDSLLPRPDDQPPASPTSV